MKNTAFAFQLKLKPVLASFALLGLFGLSACSKAPETDTKKAQTPAPVAAPAPIARPSIGLAVSTLNNPFFVALRDGAQKEADAQNIELITVDAQDDPAKQQASVEDLIQKKVKVILINPTDSAAAANVVKNATSKGIQVISLDRSITGAEVSSHIASDNVAGGKLAAEYLLEKLAGKGQILELEGIPGSSAARERGEGFHAVIDNQKEIKLLAKQPADFDRSKGLTVMENMLQTHKKVQGVFAHNDEMALGALKAIEAAKLKNVIVIGFDATNDALAAVKSGTLAATIQQQPELIGQFGVQAAKKLIDGQPVEKSIPVPLNLVKP